jgi:hypothetical protein
MMKKMLLLITALLLTSVFSASTPHVHASGAVEITPSTAFVGTPFREILIYVKAWDDGWATSVSLAAKNVPIGLSISFQPKSVSNPLPGPHTIESTMTVNGGTAARGSYDITIEATWTSLNPFDPTWHRSTVLHLEVNAVPEGTITANPYLVVNQGVWTKRTFGWNPGTGSTWDLEPAGDLYVNWYANGQVHMRTSDTVFDWNGIACEFKQQVSTVSLNPAITQLTLRASARNISGNHASSPSWEGIKFDAWAKSTKDNHRLFVEMYFYRSGINLNWDPVNKQVNPGNVDTDDYMVNIASSDAEISSHVKIKQESGNSLFTIDLTYFFQQGAKAFNRTLADYVLDTIGINCEAGNVGPYPTCWVTLSYLESMGSYLADVNCDGSINIMDIVLVTSCFGAQFGSANYRPAADINLDKIIDIFDLTIVSSKFGKIFPNS